VLQQANWSTKHRGCKHKYEREDAHNLLRLGGGFLAFLFDDVVQAASHVQWQRHVDAFGVSQVQVLHDLAETFDSLAQFEPGVEFDFLGDSRGGESLVVVRGPHLGLGCKFEELVRHGVEERGAGSLLEVGAAAAADEKRVSGEHHWGAVLVSFQIVGNATGSVSRRSDNAHTEVAERHGVVFLDLDVRHGARDLGDHGFGVGEDLLEFATAGDVVCVHVGVGNMDEVKSKLFDELGIALNELEDGVDEERLALVGEDVRVGARFAVENLSEEKSHGWRCCWRRAKKR